MATVKRTDHIVLAKVTSHKSAGRAEIIVGHKSLTVGWTDPALTANKFKKFPVGTMLTVKIKLSGRRRLIQIVVEEPDANTVEKFNYVYGEQMAKEARAYSRMHPEGDFPVGDETLEEIFGIGSVATASTSSPVEESSDPFAAAESVLSAKAQKWAQRIYVKPADQSLFETVHAISNRHHVGVMMIGPSGYGKTSVPQQMADDWGMTFWRQDCATVRDPEEFFGYRGAVEASTMTADGETYFAESRFTEVLSQGNAVIVLDELNRVDPYISNILFPLLDHAGRTTVAGHEIIVGPNVIFVATVNLGFQFTGTFTLDTALTNRFIAKVVVGPLPMSIEESVLQGRTGVDEYQSKKIVRLMTGLRQLNNKGELSVDASTRVSLQIAELMNAGLDMKMALAYVVSNGLDTEEAKKVADQYGLAT
jgi:MoxR-like ATPase